MPSAFQLPPALKNALAAAATIHVCVGCYSSSIVMTVEGALGFIADVLGALVVDDSSRAAALDL